MTKKEEKVVKAEEVRTEPVRETSGTYCVPPVDVYETDEAILVEADMPGVERTGVEVKIDNGLLTILGRVTRQGVKDVTQLYEEFVPGDYYRAFTVGDAVSEGGISAAMKDGVLTVTLLKAERARVHRIEVK